MAVFKCDDCKNEYADDNAQPCYIDVGYGDKHVDEPTYCPYDNRSEPTWILVKNKFINKGDFEV